MKQVRSDFKSRVGCIFGLTIILALLTAASSHAKYLTIVGSPSVNVAVQEGGITLTGSYQIENQGDETALNVFPKFTIGAWNWAGKPQDLKAGKRGSWQIDGAFIPAEKLSCGEDASCASLALPIRGVLPLLVARHYSDTNGYTFSSPEVIGLSVGEFSGEEQVSVLTPPVAATLAMAGDGREFSGDLHIINRAQSPKTALVAYFTSDELLSSINPSIVEVPAGGEVVVGAAVKNVSGLAGSTYPVFAVIQWKEGDVRALKIAFASVVLQKPEGGGWFLIVGVVAFFLVGALVFAMLRKK